MREVRSIVLTGLVTAIALSDELQAGGPLLIGKDGVARRWNTASPVVLNLDKGPLGGITDPDSLLVHARDQWNAVPTSRLRLSIGDDLPIDIENFDQFNEWTSKNDGRNPMIYDSDGSIFDELFGPGNAVIGVAGPALVSSKGAIIKGFAMFNGDEASPGDFEILRAVVTHELGHMLNLDHAQINGLPFFSLCANRGTTVPGFSGSIGVNDVETMFPILVNAPGLSPHPMATLHRDDWAAISTLYPVSGFGTTTGAIRGNVVDFSGAPVHGVNVIVRSISSPFAEAASFVSGGLVVESGSTVAPARRGDFELRGLIPGAYRLYVEEVSSCFTEGAGVGPLDPPLNLDPSDPAAFLEFWSGPRESSLDDPLDAEAIELEAGEVLDLQIILNGTRPRVASIDPASGSYASNVDVAIAGVNFSGATAARLSGPEVVLLGSLNVTSGSRLTATVPAGTIPGLYVVSVTTPRGTSDETNVTYTSTEPLPIVTTIAPSTLLNDVSREATVFGQHLLGASSAALVRSGLPAIPVEITRITSAGAITIGVPVGILPGTYNVVVANTAGSSDPSSGTLAITELSPVLIGDPSPPRASNSGARDVTIGGQNLAGTTVVELVSPNGDVSVQVISTSFGQVLVRVPGGVEPGMYVVRVTNSAGSATGPSTFEVRKSSGGGGGCGVAPPGTGDPDFTALLVLAGTLVVARRILRRPDTAGSGNPA